MMRTLQHLTLLICTLALGGCVIGQKSRQPDDLGEAEAKDAYSAALSGKPKNFALKGEELDVWDEKAFRRMFNLSYTPDTEIEPKVRDDEIETLSKVVGLVREEKLDEAAQMLKDNMNEASSAVFDFTLANIYFQGDQLDGAVTYYRSAVRKFEKFRRAWQNLGLVHVRRSEFDKALPCFVEVVKLGGKDAITYGLMGICHSQLENPIGAESAFRNAMLLEPDNTDWQMGLARSFFKQERYADAVAHTAKMIKKRPNNAQLWLLQANGYLGMNEPMRAAENFEIVDRLGKATPESLYMLGDIYVNEALYDMSVSAYVRAMTLIEKQRQAKAESSDGAATEPPVKADRAIRAAKVMTAQAAHDETRDLIRQIRKTYADSLTKADRTDLLKLEARIAGAQDATEQQIEIWKQVAELDPQDGDVLLQLGQYYAGEGDDARAVNYYTAAQLLPKYEADAKVRHAQLLVRQAKYDEALPLLRSAQQIKPRESVERFISDVERMARR